MYIYVKKCINGFDNCSPGLTLEMLTLGGYILGIYGHGIWNYVQDNTYGYSWNDKWYILLDTEEKFNKYKLFAKNKVEWKV